MVQESPNRWSKLPDQSKEATALAKEQRTAKRKQLEKDIAVAQSMLPGPNSPNYKAQAAQLDKLRGQLDSLWSNPNAAEPATAAKVLKWNHEKGDFAE